MSCPFLYRQRQAKITAAKNQIAFQPLKNLPFGRSFLYYVHTTIMPIIIPIIALPMVIPIPTLHLLILSGDLFVHKPAMPQIKPIKFQKSAIDNTPRIGHLSIKHFLISYSLNLFSSPYSFYSFCFRIFTVFCISFCRIIFSTRRLTCRFLF